MARASRLRRLAATLVPLILAAGVLAAAPASATAPVGLGSGTPVVGDPNPAGPATEATIVDMRLTSALFGGFVDNTDPQAPYPSTGLRDQRSVTTAQIVLDDPNTGGTDELLTFCIDIDTDTTVGTHYELGDWTSANVTNLPYVQWILDTYPTTGSSTAAQVRAVQGAIWYFTDQFVVNRFYPTERNAVRTIVEAAQAALAGGTPPAPPQPSITVAPDAATVPAGTVSGPYAVSTANLTGAASISIPAGTEVFRDEAATIPVASGDPVADGDALWVRFAAGAIDPGFVVTGAGTAPAGNVYLYDGNNPPRTTAQKLVLAADAVVPARAELDLTAAATGTLEVQIGIAGAAAGAQGQIELLIDCVAPGWSLSRPAYLPANAPASVPLTVATVDGIPAGASCDVTQPDDGDNAFADLESTNAPLEGIAVEPGAPVVAAVSNVYAVPAPPTGALQIDVAVSGPAAGAQSALELVATCAVGSPAATVTRTIPVAAGLTGTTTVATITDLPVGAECGIVQTIDGRDADAALASTTSPVTAGPITAGAPVVATIANVYDVPVPVTGTLAVDLTVAGAAAGRQSAVELTATCTLDATTRTIPITAAAGLTGTTRVATIDDIEADTMCVVTQTADGANANAVLSASVIAPASVEIRDAATAVVTVTDTYAAATPSPTPTPTPTPTPSPSVLPATGADGTGPWALGLLALALGLVVVVADVRRRRATRG